MPGTEESPPGKETVLFICTFNSVRSQIAEGLLRARCGDRFEICSAGIAPAGLNPYAVTVMKEIGIDISQQRGKSLNRFSGKTFTYVVTLCEHARLALSGSLPAGLYVNHRAFTSPSELRKNKAEILSDFRVLRDDINGWLTELFPDCPDQKTAKSGTSSHRNQ
jgi:arsenate reductase (thioredoxin)